MSKSTFVYVTFIRATPERVWSDRPDSKLIHAVSGGWPRIIANLKSLLETGEVVLKPSGAAA